MANELKHGSVGTELTQAEWEAVGTHVVANQAVGDIIYASTTAQLRRLGAGSTNDVLRITGGLPDWQATSFITSLGTIATGVWQGTDVGVAYGGTGVSTHTQNGVLVGNGASAIGSIDMSTKGHVLIGDGSGNPQMLGVGTNNHVMTADSGETTGVKWAAPAAAAAGSLTGSTLASGVVTTSATTVGVLNSGSINIGFGNIDVGASSIAAGSFDASDGNITNVGDIALDSLSADGTNIIVNGAIDVQAGYANGGGAPYDGVVDAAGGGNWTTLQAGDDALDAAINTVMLVKSGTYSTLTVDTNNVKIVCEPGTIATGAIVLSGDNITLVLGAGCDMRGLITLSGDNCSLLCENGVDLEGITSSGNYNMIDGGGWDTISNGGSATDAVLLSGTDCIVENIALQTTGGAFDGVYTTGARAVIRNCQVVDSDDNGISIVSTDCSVEGCLILGAGAYGIAIFTSRARVVGNHTIATGSFGIYIAGGGDNSVVNSNMVQTPTTETIKIHGDAENCVVVGNRLDGIAVNDLSGTSTVASNDATAF